MIPCTLHYERLWSHNSIQANYFNSLHQGNSEDTYESSVWVSKNFLWVSLLQKTFQSRQSKVLLKVLYYWISLSLQKRHTVFVDSVEHSLSVWYSVKGTKNAFDISLIRKRRVFGIGDIAVFHVRNTRRLNSWTANKSAGNWAFKKFEIQSSILFKLFDPIFGK